MEYIIANANQKKLKQTKMETTNTNNNELKYVPMYKSYIDSISFLEDKDRLTIYEAIFNYGFTGIIPNFENPYLNMAWGLIKPNLDNNINSVKSKQINGSKGGRPKKEENKPSIEKPIQNKAPEPVISIQPIAEDQNEEIVPQIEDNEVLDTIEEDIIEEDNSNEKEKSVFEMSLKELVNSPNSDYLIGTNYVPQALVEFIPLIEGKQGLLNQLIKKYDKESFVYKLREILESKKN